MKKWIVTFILTFTCLSIAACGKKSTEVQPTTQAEEVTTSEETATEEPSSEISTEQIDNGETAEYAVTIDMQEDKKEFKNDDGVLLLVAEESFPDVTIDGSAAAADNINDFYAKEKQSFESQLDEYKANAEEEYKIRIEQDPNDWTDENAYQAETKYSIERADDNCISIVNDSYDYLGGAHPNAYRSAAVFNTADGEKLTLKDVFKDEDKAKAFIVDYLLKEMKDPKYEGAFFEDYEKDVPSIIDDNSWYLSKDGFVIICNEYIVSPHAAGIMEFTIPYDECNDMLDEYKSATK